MDDLKSYLKPTEAIDSEHEMIQELAEKLTLDCTSEVEKVIKLFYFVRDSIRYNIYMASVFLEDFKASTVLRREKGYCVQKAVLLTALGRAALIPSRLSFAKIKNHRIPAHLMEKMGTNIFPRHGYNQFFLSGKWISAAATFDRELCTKNKLPTVEFDGIHDAILPQTDLDGNPYIEYLEKYSPQADLPLEWIAKEIVKFWGPDKRAWLNGESLT
ncbi:MAG: transglutaminase family protein [Chloroflexota bacterium]|nr:transglutaminase family protein [Chloroflexota bacterium]